MIDVTVSWLQIDAMPAIAQTPEPGAGSTRKRRATRRPALQITQATIQLRNQRVREREFPALL